MTQSSPPDAPPLRSRLVSLIIPVLDTERSLLSRCIESVLDQSYADLEVIIVNDGSTPACASGLEEIAARDPRVTVLHQEHHGVSSARNFGVAHARGEYIGFVDSDDRVSRDYLTSAVELADRTEADAVFGGILVTTGSTSIRWRDGTATAANPLILTGTDLTNAGARSLAVSPSPHRPTTSITLTNVVSALFQRGIAQATHFPDGVSHAEDRLYLVDALGRSRKIAVCADVWYFYAPAPGSVSQDPSLASARRLPTTVAAFASAGGFDPRGRGQGVAPAIRDAAALGVVNYVKLLSGMLAASTSCHAAVPLLQRALEGAGVAAALAHAAPSTYRDRLFLRLARARRLRTLYFLGRGWVLTSRGAPQRRNTRLLGSESSTASSDPPSAPAPRSSVALIVHWSESNYGNHLVNYAARHVLESCGSTVELVHFTGREPQNRQQTVARLPQKLRRLGVRGVVTRASGRVLRSLRRSAASALDPENGIARETCFREFAEAHLRPRAVSISERGALPSRYARFVIGSDQIWNYDAALGPWHFADFAHPDDVIALSPSIGHPAIPLEWQTFYSKHLARFREVGVRELDWTNTAGTPAERPAFTRLIDPTLVLTREMWEALATPRPEAKGRLLVYTLGSLSDEHETYVAGVQSLHSVEVLRLSAEAGGPHWATDASAFLGMVAASSGVVTDSYHGAVFAFLFDKPLTLIPRAGFAGAMNSRIDTLVSVFGLENRVFEHLTPAAALSHDYTRGDVSLAHERDVFWAYLERHGYTRQSTPRPARCLT